MLHLETPCISSLLHFQMIPLDDPTLGTFNKGKEDHKVPEV
jgi:hypothetical protein